MNTPSVLGGAGGAWDLKWSRAQGVVCQEPKVKGWGLRGEGYVESFRVMRLECKIPTQGHGRKNFLHVSRKDGWFCSIEDHDAGRVGGE